MIKDQWLETLTLDFVTINIHLWGNRKDKIGLELFWCILNNNISLTFLLHTVPVTGLELQCYWFFDVHEDLVVGSHFIFHWSVGNWGDLWISSHTQSHTVVLYFVATTCMYDLVIYSTDHQSLLLSYHNNNNLWLNCPLARSCFSPTPTLKSICPIICHGFPILFAAAIKVCDL